MTDLKNEERCADKYSTSDIDLELSSLKVKSELPADAVRLETQVAGHSSDKKKCAIGMLKDKNGHVLKPVDKPNLGEREIDFYMQLQLTTDPLFEELRQYVPEYYGTKNLYFDDRCVKFLELEDIAEGMSEPCIMDIKIGQRTWDPLAGAEKQNAEDSKYAASKKAYGFCIPGFQVYRLDSGKLQKFDKAYGKSLNEQSVVDALEIFLNGSPERAPCRELIMKLLSILWKILTLIREQKKYRLYSSSLLVAYDAKRLRHFIRKEEEEQQRKPVAMSMTNRACTESPEGSPPKMINPLALNNLNSNNNNNNNVNNNNSMHISKQENCESTKPRLHISRSAKNLLSLAHSKGKSKSKLRLLERSISLNSYEIPVTPYNNVMRMSHNGWDLTPSPTLLRERPCFEVNKLCRTHSFDNNFDMDMKQIKEDYATLLADLNTTSAQKERWVRVNMIDFSHVFPAPDNTEVDKNYLQGIESFVKLLESFLNKS